MLQQTRYKGGITRQPAFHLNTSDNLKLTNKNSSSLAGKQKFTAQKKYIYIKK